jgi:excisionase family DNA binding protein
VIKLPEKQLFRPDEVADLLQLKSVTTVYRWIQEGKIRYVRSPGGQQKRITRSEVERITREMQEDPKTRTVK